MKVIRTPLLCSAAMALALSAGTAGAPAGGRAISISDCLTDFARLGDTQVGAASLKVVVIGDPYHQRDLSAPLEGRRRN